MDIWQILKIELHKEAEGIFSSAGEVVLIESELDSALTLSHRVTTLKLTHVPERNAVRWDTDLEYGFERLSEPAGQLAKTLMKRLYRGRSSAAGDMASFT